MGLTFEKAFHISTIVEDVVVHNSNVYAVSNQEKLYLYSQSQQGGNSRRFFNGDCGYYFDQVVVDTPIDSYSSTNVNMRRARRRRLVVLTSSKDHDSNKLYMIIPVVSFKGFMRAVRLQFKVKELKQKGSSKWIWEEVTCFGDGDQVLFVSRDYCFFVDVAEFPECHLRNCIVFSDDAFPEYSESECCWNYGSKGGNEVAVFSLEGHGRFSVPVDSYFPNILWSIPLWLSQNTSSLQPQAQSQSQSRRQRLCSEPGITPSDSNVRHKKPLKSASEEQSIGFSSSNEAQAESAKIFPDMTDVRHSVNHDVGRDDVEDANGQIQSDFSAHLVQPFEKKVVTVKFQGIDVELEHLPILEKVRRKYGDVVDGSAIRGCDAITMIWTSLAKLLLILQSNSGNTLTDDQAHYLSTTLSDLKFMQLKVDWLVPHVKKALAMQKRKQLQASLAEIEKAKARAEEMERNLLSEMAELRQDGPFHLEDCLDDGVF